MVCDMVVDFNQVLVEFVGQGHRSEFTAEVGIKMRFLLWSEGLCCWWWPLASKIEVFGVAIKVICNGFQQN